MSSVIYVGHIPDGFVEKDMWKYFSQFGALNRLKLFRSKKTGKSKGFAFVHFRDEEVAKIVASTMNNYLMFNKILKCHVVPKEKLHANMFKNWNKLCRPDLLKHKNMSKQNGFKTNDQIETMRQRLASQIRKQNKKLADVGINYSFPVTWDNEIKKEVESDDEADDSNLPDQQSQIYSEYSMIVDSSDDEISLKTPEQAVKRSKKNAADFGVKKEEINIEEEKGAKESDPILSPFKGIGKMESKKKSESKKIVKTPTVNVSNKKSKRQNQKSKNKKSNVQQGQRYFVKK